MKHVGIIGAGAAGLCALRHVVSEDDLTPIVWEHSSQIGGTWIYRPHVGNDEYGFPIHSSMYKNLTTNLPKEIMAFPDFPFKSRSESYIHHTEVLDYLNDYVNHFKLKQWIKFNHHVEWVEPIEKESGPTTWKITVKNLLEGTSTDVICDALVVCNGHYSTPNIPPVIDADTFIGRQMHSHDYREAESFYNLSVVVLGASASGMDISLEISKVAKMVFLSHNFPIPIPSKLPDNIHQVKGVKAAKANGFILLDGSFIEADVILYCTGYKYTFPFFSNSCGISVKDNQVKPLYNHIVNTTHPSMGLIGIPFQIVPFPVFDSQVRYMLAIVKRVVSLPSKEEMDAQTTLEFQEKQRQGKPSRHLHRMGGTQWQYLDTLAQAASFSQLPKVRYFLGVMNGRVSVASGRELHQHLQPEEGIHIRHYHKMGSKQWPYLDRLASEAKTQPLNAYYRTIWDITWWRRLFTLKEYKQFSYFVEESDSGSLHIVENLNGVAINSFISILFIGFKRLVILTVFQSSAIFKLLLAKGRNKLCKVFGITNSV